MIIRNHDTKGNKRKDLLWGTQWERSMKRNWMKRARQYRASGVRSRFVAAKWNVVNLSATPRMEGKGKERKREAEQPASDWYEWPTHSLYLFLLLFASSLSQPREKREGFAIDSSTRVVRRHLIHRRMCVIKDFWTIELSARTTSLALFLSRIYLVLFARHLNVSTKENVKESELDRIKDKRYKVKNRKLNI